MFEFWCSFLSLALATTVCSALLIILFLCSFFFFLSFSPSLSLSLSPSYSLSSSFCLRRNSFIYTLPLLAGGEDGEGGVGSLSTFVLQYVEGGGAGGDIDLAGMWGCWGGGGGNIGGRIWVRVGTEESMQDLALHHREYTIFATTNRASLKMSKKQKL